MTSAGSETTAGFSYNSQPSTTRRTLGFVGGLVLGAVLLIAAYAKLLDPVAFTEQIRTEGLDVVLSAQTVAFIALGLEVGLGLALVLGIRRWWVLVPATLLVAFFLVLTGRTYWLDRQGLLDETSSCGCFGNLVDRTPAEAFWQDLALLVPPLLLAWIGRDRLTRSIPPLRTAGVAAGTVAALIFAAQAPDLPLDDLATRLKPGVEVDDLCTGANDNRVCMTLVVPELMQGRHVVVMAQLDEPEAKSDAKSEAKSDAIVEAVPQLNDYAMRGAGPRLWVIGELTPERQNQLYWQWGPAFDLRAAPASLLRPLYRRLPRSFLVEDGEVVETFRGLPPLLELAGAATATPTTTTTTDETADDPEDPGDADTLGYSEQAPT